MRKMKKHWIETGKGSKGSIFVESSTGRVIQAVRAGRTLSGLQIWRLYDKTKLGIPAPRTVYVKNKKELLEALY